MPLSTASPAATVPMRVFQRPACSSPSRRKISPPASQAGAAIRSPTAKCTRNGCSSAGIGASCRCALPRSNFRALWHPRRGGGFSVVVLLPDGPGAEEDLSKEEAGADRDEQRFPGVALDPVHRALGRLACPFAPGREAFLEGLQPAAGRAAADLRRRHLHLVSPDLAHGHLTVHRASSRPSPKAPPIAAPGCRRTRWRQSNDWATP